MSESDDNKDDENPVVIPEVIKPKPKRRGWPEKRHKNSTEHRRKVDKELYEKIWGYYHNGMCTKEGDIKHTEIAALVGCHPDTVRQLYHQGMPSLGWPSYRERAKAAKQQILAQDQQLIEAAPADPITPKEIAGPNTSPAIWRSWEKIKDENLKLGNMGRATLAILMGKVTKAAEAATFTKTRRKRNLETGLWEEIEIPLNLKEVAESVKMMTAALKELGQNDSLFSDRPTEIKKSTHFEIFAGLTQDQLDYIINNNGQLPPGVDEEALLGASPAPIDVDAVDKDE